MTNTLVIQGTLLNDLRTDIIIKDNTISAVGQQLAVPQGAEIIDGCNTAVFPTFANMHSHAPMVLLRGVGDDTPLDLWLNNHIWPRERRLDDEAIYWGTRLACIEMIKSGTTAFNDMYFRLPAMAQAVADSGIRAQLGLNLFGNADELDTFDPQPHPLVSYSVAPHAVYTVNEHGLRRATLFAQSHNTAFHIHLSETQKEVSDCLAEHGCRPAEWLDRLGVLAALGPKIIAAHSLHLADDEVQLLGNHGCTVVHNPNSNLKLGSGHRFLMAELSQAGANVTLGTDGCASSNNLCMLEAAKTAALLQKGWRNDPTAAPAALVMEMASRHGFAALGLKAGRVEAGWLADLMLVDLGNLAFVPNHNTLSNLLYAAHSDAISTVVCNGRVVMRNRQVEGEAEVVAQARRCASRLMG